MVKDIKLSILDSDLNRLSEVVKEYLNESNLSNATLGLTLSFGSFSCDVLTTAKDIDNLKCEA